jgi:hypothetical protein
MLTSSRTLFILCSTLVVSSCGGGGSGDSASAAAPPPQVASGCRYVAPQRATGAADSTALAFEEQYLNELAPPLYYRAYMAPVDVDGDGVAEMVVAETAYPGSTPYDARVVIYRRGSTGWVDATSTLLVGNAKPDHVRDFEIADFNRDGRPDVLFNGHGFDAAPFPGARNQLLLSGGSRLTVSNDRLVATRNSFTHSSDSADIDCDGAVDIYEGNAFTGSPAGSMAAPRLLRNDGVANFSDVSSRLPTYVTNYDQRYLSAEFCDVNNDGAPDLFLGGFNNPSELLTNDGFGRFSRAARTQLPADAFPGSSMQAIEARCVDVDQDGWMDIVQLQLNKPFADANGPVQRRQLVWRNLGDGRFQDVTAAWMPSLQNTGYMTVLRVLDINRDGWPDLLLAAGENGNDQGLLLNAGNRFVFQRIGDGSYAAPHMEMDVDGDGKLDLVELTNSIRVRRQR